MSVPPPSPTGLLVPNACQLDTSDQQGYCVDADPLMPHDLYQPEGRWEILVEGLFQAGSGRSLCAARLMVCDPVLLSTTEGEPRHLLNVHNCGFE